MKVYVDQAYFDALDDKVKELSSQRPTPAIAKELASLEVLRIEAQRVVIKTIDKRNDSQ